jgi:hypothetical protein
MVDGSGQDFACCRSAGDFAYERLAALWRHRPYPWREAPLDHRGVYQMAFVIVRREGANRTQMWLVAAVPDQWGKRELAMRFETRGGARRAADASKLSGDWSIEPALPPPLRTAP